MTATVGTPSLSPNPTSPEKPGPKQEPAPTAGDFAGLIHQAVLRPQARAKGAPGTVPRPANQAAKDENQDPEGAPKTSAREKEGSLAAARATSWWARFVASVSLQPAAVPEPVTACSGNERCPSDPADAGFLRAPTRSPGRKESGSLRTNKPKAPGMPASETSSNERAPSTSADIGLPLAPAPSVWQGENAIPRAGKPEAPEAPAPEHPGGDQSPPASADVGLSRALTPAVSLDQGGNVSPRADRSEAPGVSQGKDENAGREESAKPDSHRQSSVAVRTEPGSRGTEDAPAGDFSEQLSAASAPQPISSDQSSPPSRTAVPEPAPDVLPSVSGMSAALHRNTMHTAPEVDENSCPAEQILPALEAAAASPQSGKPDRRPSVALVDRAAASTTSVPATGADAAALIANSPVVQAPLTRTETSSAPPTPGQTIARAVENTVVGLQHANANSLAVVLKPDGNTEISLHFSLRHGHFEALAVLERGDYRSLTSEWGQLQSRLADQGIRLAALASNLPHNTGFAGGQSSSPKQPQDEASSADFPRPAIASSPARTSEARIVRSTTGREWWA
jgi:hypothetical protein